MRVLLDENLPRRLKDAFPADVAVATVRERNWEGVKNGELLQLAEDDGFDVFVTMDKGIAYQQNLAGRTIAILTLRANSNRIAELLPLIPAVTKILPTLSPGTVTTI